MIPQATLEDAESAAPLARSAVLDVRTPEEFASGHVPGALAIPLHVVPLRLSELDRSTSYVVVCESGARSAQATAYLLQHGYEARSMTGGMAAWRATGRAVQTGTATGAHA
ncbi:MAG: rhodanese-like domain-containing protein [Candidatus Nanopelagicales bacterium]